MAEEGTRTLIPAVREVTEKNGACSARWGSRCAPPAFPVDPNGHLHLLAANDPLLPNLLVPRVQHQIIA
jgi:hypothetical protein